MIRKEGWSLTFVILVAILLIAFLSLRSNLGLEVKAADTVRFDYVTIVSPAYVHQGNQGVLLLDRRNGNVWFFGRTNELGMAFKDPIMISRLPLDKLE